MRTRLPRHLALMATGAVALALVAPAARATTAPDVETARQQVAQLGTEVEAAAAEYRDVEVRLAAQQHQVAAAEARVDSQAALVASLEQQVVALAVQTYKSGGVDPRLSLLASGGTGVTDSTKLLGMVAERRTATLGDVRDEQAELERLRDATTAELGSVQALQADLTQRRADIEARLAGAKDVLAVAEAEAQRQLALEEARKAAEASRSGGTASASAGAAPAAADVVLPVSDGLLTTPTPGRQSAYGWRIHPVYGVRKFHSGMDISIGCGTPVVAAADGVVESAKWDGTYGNIIVLRHGGSPAGDLSTAYAHLSEYAVTSGAVSKGEVIGYVGTTGLSTGCHLHFEVRVGGEDVDPAGFI